MTAKYKTRKNILLAIALIFSMLIGIFAGQQFKNQNVVQSENAPQQPLYWVAPMDPDYRRDKPGKSPMGMDLVPVYANDLNNEENEVGAVYISPHVENNLGVRTDFVTLEPLKNEVVSVGVVSFDESQLIHIHPRVEGWIEQLFVTAEGDPVTKGQPLYTLYSPQLVNAQEELLIALSRKNESLINAAKGRLKALQLKQEFIRELEQTRQIKQTVTINSPQSGVVRGLKIREGFYVNPGNTLFSIGKLDRVWIEADVLESDARLIHQGQPTEISLDYFSGQRWQGKVDYIYPTLNPTTRTLRVRIELDNPNGVLKPNMYAQVQFFTETQMPSLLVPKEAVIRTGQQDRVVLKVGAGHYKSIEVILGQKGKTHVEIVQGLAEGDEVVTSAQFLLDSESSKTSDFKRQEPREEHHDHSRHVGNNKDNKEADTDDKSAYPSASVAGLINSVDESRRVLNITRGAIEKWQRPATTMDFYLDQQIEFSGLKAGDKVYFTFEVREEFVITAIKSIANDIDISTDASVPSHHDHQEPI